MSEPIRIRKDWQAVTDHSRERPEYTYVYAVVSRRSGGLSLGVNLNPDKVCNFDCIYCEVDRTTPPRTRDLDVSRMAAELTSLIRHVRDGGLAREPKFAGLPTEVTHRIRDIAFSGDGEPTLIPNFAECARAVAAIRRAEGLEDAKLVLITDAAGLDKADVRDGLAVLDANHGEVWAKLDAGTEPYYKLVNRTSVRFDRILSNLLLAARARPLVIQTLLLRVQGQAMPAAELDAYTHRLTDILRDGGHIREVHAYTVARPTPDPAATALDAESLHQAAEYIRQKTGLRVLTFA